MMIKEDKVINNSIHKLKILNALIIVYGLSLIKSAFDLARCFFMGLCKLDNFDIVFINLISLITLLIIQYFYRFGRYWLVSICLTAIVDTAIFASSPKFAALVGTSGNVYDLDKKIFSGSLILITLTSLSFYLFFIKKEFSGKTLQGQPNK